MKALTVLYGAGLSPPAFEPSFGGKPAVVLAAERALRFPGTEKVVVIPGTGGFPALPGGVELAGAGCRNKKELLEILAGLSAGFDLTYYAWADCPLLDPVLAGAVAGRHLRYAAEYSYADGWPYGFAPEILAPGTAGVLAKILEGGGDSGGPVGRDALFQVIQKDINAFDIETEISPVDLRLHRLSLTADTRRNCLLVSRFIDAGVQGAGDAADLIEKRPELLRTLPAFYTIQAAGGCPQACAVCPWPKYGAVDGKPVTSRRDYMDPGKFGELLDKITAFSGDAVIDLSLWGEVALHPGKMELVSMVLSRPGLSLVLETSGLGWKAGELEALASKASALPSGCGGTAPLSWIVSLDAFDAGRYGEMRGPGFTEAADCAKRLLSLFPGSAYVQAVRCKGAEDDIELFYRSWKDQVPAGGRADHVIIQKYDDFCGVLPRLQASDLSPVKRRPCWHIMRDVPVLLDGTVPVCREDLSVLNGGSGNGAGTGRPVAGGVVTGGSAAGGPVAGGPVLGNVFTDSLETIWERGNARYREHCSGDYRGICAGCDEYYTYNF